jgi:hypothetical protein
MTLLAKTSSKLLPIWVPTGPESKNDCAGKTSSKLLPILGSCRVVIFSSFQDAVK